MAADRITANLPSRDFDATAAFYGQLGFAVLYRDDGWLILQRGPLEVEFFHHPKLVPAESWHSACLRVDEADALQARWQALALGDDPMGNPREMAFVGGPGTLRFFPIIDPDGSLLRVIDNGSV